MGLRQQSDNSDRETGQTQPVRRLAGAPLFTPTDVELRPTERLVGNPGDIDLLARLEKLEQKVLRVSREHAEHQDRYHEVRKCTLDD